MSDRTPDKRARSSARPPRPSYLQYANVVSAWAAFITAFYTAGPTAQRRFEDNYGKVPKKIEGARR